MLDGTAGIAIGDGFADFYRAHAHLLVGFVVRLGARPADAQDIAQDTMAELFRQWMSTRVPERWILTVATRKFLKTLSTLRELLTDRVPDTSAGVLSPQHYAEVAESAIAVNALLGRLTPQQRMIMVLRMYEFQDIEIARELKTTPRTVRTQANRARETLRPYVRTMQQPGEVLR